MKNSANITQRSLYFDHNATTAVHGEVLEAMMPYFTQKYGNAASSTHRYGWQASAAIDDARQSVAQIWGCEPAEVYFTSGATEALNIALQGICRARLPYKKKLLVGTTEHKVVLEICAFMAHTGVEVVGIGCDRQGLIDMDAIESQIDNNTMGIIVMHANNETGVIQPIEAIGALAHKHGAIMVSDTTQSVGKIPCKVYDLNIDVAVVSAHKLYGPKGVGALYARRKSPRVSISPLLYGGGHEHNLRPGTANTPGIVGLAKACTLAAANIWEYGAHTSRLRTSFEQAFTELGVAHINGSTKHRLPNTTNLCFLHKNANDIIQAFPHIAFATGSACSSAIPTPSHVLTQMGLSPLQVAHSLRFSFGLGNTIEEINYAVSELTAFTNQN